MGDGGGLCAGGKYLGCRCLGKGPTDPHVGDTILTRSPAEMERLKGEWKAEEARKGEASAKLEEMVHQEIARREEVEKKWPEYVSLWWRSHYPDTVEATINWMQNPKRIAKRDDMESEETKKRGLGPNIVSVEDANRHRYGTKDTPDYIKERLRKEGEEAMKHPHKPARPAFFENEPLYGDT